MPTCVDLFCGAGGFSLGFDREGFDILSGLDINRDALKTYRHNIDARTVVNEDITNMDTKTLPKEGCFAPEEVDVVIGGPPCKGFSLAGSRDCDDPRNRLISKYLQMLEFLDPHVVILENVTGILSMNDGKYVDTICREFQRLGFAVGGPTNMSAAAFGVPQLRERVFITGIQEDKPLEMPTPTHSHPDATVDGDIPEAKLSAVTVKEALSDLAFLGIGDEVSDYQTSSKSTYQEEMRAGTNQLYNHVSTNHGESVQERFKTMDPGDTIDDLPEELQTSKHTQKRMHPDEPSSTVTTLPEDIIHYSNPRIPTVREVARLQSFPDWFEFKGPRTTGGQRRAKACPQYSQVGNAVPPRLAAAFAKQIKQRLQSNQKMATPLE